MTINIPHNKSQQEVAGLIDTGVDRLLSKGGMQGVELVAPQKSWAADAEGHQVMTFSVTGRMGFIKVPVAGTVTVTPAEVIVVCELPQMVKNFLGEAKVRAGVESQIKGLLTA